MESLTDLKLAPFHLLATEGHVHTDKDHRWHMETLAEVCRADPELLRATPYQVVDVTDPASQAAGIAWWEELTGRGGEGMVVKPLSFIHRGSRGLSQPAVKCRGREYLRIIYGPDYTTEANLSRLAVTGPGPEAVAGPGRVRPGRRGAGAVRAAGAAAAGPRVRLRRAGPGERAGGPEALRRDVWTSPGEGSGSGARRPGLATGAIRHEEHDGQGLRASWTTAWWTSSGGSTSSSSGRPRTRPDGHLNVSPKGLDTFRILGPKSVAYLDLTGSGIETVAHLRQNGRITIMFCAFEGRPLILRLYGRGRVVEPGDPEWDGLIAGFPEYPGVRSVVVVDVERIADSCGFAVPLYEYKGERSQLIDYAEQEGAGGHGAVQGPEEPGEHRRDRRAPVGRGRRAMRPAEPTPAPVVGTWPDALRQPRRMTRMPRSWTR